MFPRFLKLRCGKAIYQISILIALLLSPPITAQTAANERAIEKGPYVIFYDWFPNNYEDLRDFEDELAPEMKIVLDALLENLGDRPYQIRIVSFTTPDRQRSLYEEVGSRRYQLARDYLVVKGVESELISGEILVLESPLTGDGVRQIQLRRSEILLTPL